MPRTKPTTASSLPTLVRVNLLGAYHYASTCPVEVGPAGAKKFPFS